MTSETEKEMLNRWNPHWEKTYTSVPEISQLTPAGGTLALATVPPALAYP